MPQCYIIRKFPLLFKFVHLGSGIVVNLKVHLSFTVSLDCLVNKNVSLIEYSINILPLAVIHDVPRVHTVNNCAAHIYAKYPFLQKVTSMLFFEGDEPKCVGVWVL